MIMYNITCNKKFVRSLNVASVEERFSDFKKSKLKNIIYIKDVFDNSTFRYRTYNVMQAMENSKKYHVNCFLESEINLIIPFLEKIDLIILQRCKWSFKLNSFINLVKSYGIKVCYDMDDLLYHSKYVPEYIENTGVYDELNVDVHFAVAGRYQQVAKMCDFFLVTTDGLKEHIENDLEKKVFVYPNFLNREQEDISSEIIAIKDSKNDSSKFYIGYFSGSNSHARDLGVILFILLLVIRS